HLLLVS
ncbi:hypothetical protein D030_1024B, partial [Vibrio parahaemolyticus AQ3810]